MKCLLKIFILQTFIVVVLSCDKTPINEPVKIHLINNEIYLNYSKITSEDFMRFLSKHSQQFGGSCQFVIDLKIDNLSTITILEELFNQFIGNAKTNVKFIGDLNFTFISGFVFDTTRLKILKADYENNRFEYSSEWIKGNLICYNLSNNKTLKENIPFINSIQEDYFYLKLENYSYHISKLSFTKYSVGIP